MSSCIKVCLTKMNMTSELYTTADVKKVREQLLKEQGGLDLLTGESLVSSQAVTDHNHKTQYVRGVIGRQANAVLGKIENLWTRYLSYWYNGTLPEFLRQCADYLERPEDTRFVHPGWIRRVTIDFCRLNVKGQTTVLHTLGTTQGKNAAERKKLFGKAIKTRQFTYEYIAKLIQQG
jgi:Recombination endonuclease VII